MSMDNVQTLGQNDCIGSKLITDRDTTFSSILFNSCSSRILRKFILLQYVPEGHMTIHNENKLIDKSSESLREYLRIHGVSWGIPLHLSRSVVQLHMRRKMEEKLEDYEMDEESYNNVMTLIEKEDFESVIPDEWKESLRSL